MTNAFSEELEPLSTQKAKNVLQASAEKQQRLGISEAERVNAAFQQLTQPTITTNYQMPEETFSEALVRGGMESIQQIPQLGYGLLAGAGAVSEAAFGPGGFSTQFKDAMVNKYQESSEGMAKYSQPTDSLTYAYEKAQEGDLSALVQWASHGFGYVAGQLATLATGVGASEKAAEVFGKQAVKKMVGKMVEKEAAKYATKKGIAATAEEAIKVGAANVAKKLGSHAAMGGTAFGMEGGEIFGDLAQQSTEAGKPLTGEQVLKGVAATGLAGGVEYLENLLGMAAVKGKLGKIPGTSFSEELGGLSGKAVRGTTAGVKTAVAESGQEAVQTGIERWGKGQEVFSDEGKQEIIDAAGLGALGGGPAAMAASVHGSTKEKEAAAEKWEKLRKQKELLTADLRKGFKATVDEAVKTASIDQYADPENENYSPITAAHAYKKVSEKETSSVLDKLDSLDKVNDLFNHQIKLAEEAHQELEAVKGDGKTALTKEQKQQRKDAEAKYSAAMALANKLHPIIKQIRAKNTTDQEPVDLLKTVHSIIETTQSEEAPVKDQAIKSIQEIFGSGKNIQLGTKDSESLKKLVEDSHVDDATKGILQQLLVEQESLTKYQEHARKHSKSTEDVSKDILKGGVGYKGINQYRQAISVALSQKNVDRVGKEFQDFKKWVDQRSLRANTFHHMREAIKTGNAFDPKVEAQFQTYRRANGTMYDLTDAFEPTIQNMRYEAEVLQQALETSKQLIAASMPGIKLQQSGTTTSRPASVTPKKAKPVSQEPAEFKLSEKVQKTLLDAGFSAEQVSQMKPTDVNQHLQAIKKKTSVKQAATKQTAESVKEDEPVKSETIETRHSQKVIFTDQQIQALRDLGLKDTQIKHIPHVQRSHFIEHLSKNIDELRAAYKQTGNIKDPAAQKAAQRAIGRLGQLKIQQAKEAASVKQSQTPVQEEKVEPVIEATTEEKKATEESVIQKEEQTSSEEVKPGVEQASDVTEQSGVNEDEIEYEEEEDPTTVNADLQNPEIIQKGNWTEEPLNEQWTNGEAPKENTPFWQVNQIKQLCSAKKLPKTATILLHHTKDILKELTADQIQKYKHIFTKKHPYNEKAQVVLDSVSSFGSDFQKAFANVFTPANKNYEYQNPLNYFIDEKGKIPTNIINAMMAVGYQWIATQGTKSLFNDVRAIRSIINQPNIDDMLITPQTHELLQQIGNSRSHLIQGLGRDALKLLKINFGDQVDADLEERLELALGGLTVTTLKELGYLESTYVNGVEFKNLKDSYVKDRVSVNTARFFQKAPEAGTVEFLKARSSDHPFTMIPALDAIAKVNSDSRHTIDLIFKGHENRSSYSWIKPKYKKGVQFKARRSGDKLSVQATQRAIKDSQHPWVVNAPCMNAFAFLGKAGQRICQGYVDIENQHISKERANDGINLSIRNSIAYLGDWVRDAIAQENGLASEFYIRNVFWKQGRMGMDSLINPQGDKLHRAVFNRKGWYVPYDLTDDYHDTCFKLGIALMLDIEIIKSGGIEGTLKALLDKLNLPEVQAGIAALTRLVQSVDDINTVDFKTMVELGNERPEDQQAVLTAIKAGKLKAESLKGLIEYVRYQEAKKALYAKAIQSKTVASQLPKTDREFISAMTLEVDGTANGTAIGRIQLLDPNAPEMLMHLAALQGSGLQFHQDSGDNGERPWDISEHLAQKGNYDSYKTTAYLMMCRLTAIAQNTITKDPELLGNQDINDVRGLQVIQRLLGDFIDSDQNITKAARKVTKPATTKVMYSQGPRSMGREFFGVVQDAINDKIASFITDRDQETANQFNMDMRILTGQFIFKTVRDPETKELKAILPSVKSLQQLVLNDQQLRRLQIHLNQYELNAMGDAINSLFAPIQEVSRAITQGVTILTAIYNVTRKHAIDMAVDKKFKKMSAAQIMTPNGKPITRNHVQLTKAEMTKIDQYLDKMIPRFKGPNGMAQTVVKIQRDTQENNYRAVEVKKSKRSQQHGMKLFPSKYNLLEKPGVGTLVGGIQNFDGTNANWNMGYKHPILNTHDGFTVSALYADDFTQFTNENFYKLHERYSLAEAFNNMLVDTLKASADVTKVLAARGDNIGQYKIDLVDEYKNLGIRKVYDRSIGKSRNIRVSDLTHLRKEAVSNLDRITKRCVAAKEEILQATIAMSQFASGNGKYKVPGKKEASDVFGFTPKEITSQAQAQIEKGLEEIADNNREIEKATEAAIKAVLENDEITNKKAFFQSGPDVTIDINEFTSEQEINQENVLQVYDQIKNDGNVPVDAAHDQHLQHVLADIVHDVMDPLNLLMQSKPNQQEGAGLFVPSNDDSGKVYIQHATPGSNLLNIGIRMSSGEVYVHELVHAITQAGLRLRPGLARKVYSLYELAFEKLDYKAFLPTGMDVTDPANAEAVEAAKARYNYLFIEPRKTIIKKQNVLTGQKMVREFSTHLDEFLTYGITNQHFMGALSQITLTDTKYSKMSWSDIKGANLQETLMNIAKKIFMFFSGRFSLHHPAQDMATELERLAIRLSKIDSKYKTQLFEKSRKFVSETFQKTFNTADSFIKAVFRKTPVIRIAHDLRSLYVGAREDDNTLLGESLRTLEAKVRTLNHGLLKSTVQEIVGRTEYTANIRDLIFKKHLTIDSVKETAANTYQKVASNLFHINLTPHDKRLLTEIGLKTDMSVLLDSIEIDRLKEILSDPRELTKEIDKSLSDLVSGDNQDLKPFSEYYKNAASALGHFMVHYRCRKNEVVFLSPKVIAEMKNVTVKSFPTKQQTQRALPLIDQLASLYALKYSAQENKEHFAHLIEQDQDAITGMLYMHDELKKASLQGAFRGDENIFMKGYIKEILNPRVEIQYGPKSQEQVMKELGFTRQPHPVPFDPMDALSQKEPVFMYVSKHGRVRDLVPSAISFTRNRAKGTNARSIANYMFQLEEIGAAEKEQIAIKKQNQLDRMSEPNFNPGKAGNYMIPQVDRFGKIQDYRYIMSQESKLNLLDQVMDFDVIFGGLASQVIDKARTPQMNKEVFQELYRLYKKLFKDNPDGFIEIGPYTQDQRLRDIYYMLPDTTKRFAHKLWDEEAIMIPKDLVTMAFGYRQYNFMDGFLKEPQDRAMLEKLIVGTLNLSVGKERALRTAGSVNEWMVDLTKLAKDNIIVKSITVSLGNFKSNLAFLRMRGVPVQYILKKGYEALTMGTKYQADQQKLNQLIVRRRIETKQGKSVQKLTHQINVLQDAISRNPCDQSIALGLMPSLIDDVETSFADNFFPSALEKYLEKTNKSLHPVLQNVGKVTFLSQDTAAYKTLNNAVQMTDFIGRHVLFNYYTQHQGMDVKIAAVKAQDEFINFEVPTHRLTEFLNKIGILWFTKYSFRILRTIFDATVDKPFTALTSYILADHLGFDHIYNSVPFISKNPLNMFGFPVTSAMDSLDELPTINLVETLLSN